MLNGKKIREVRMRMGYTARDVETLTSTCSTSISKSYLEELERGAKQNPSFKKIVVLAKVLNCKIDDFVVM